MSCPDCEGVGGHDCQPNPPAHIGVFLNRDQWMQVLHLLDQAGLVGSVLATKIRQEIRS